jgi:hypothetical protein
MRIGHIIALVGAALVALGAAVLDWQTFELAGVTAKGFEIVPAGQIALVLGLIALGAAVAGVVTRRRYQMAGIVCGAAVLGFAAVAWANMGRLGAYDVMAYESIELGFGFTLATWGFVIAFVGSLVVFASEPVWKKDGRYLRVALLWKGTIIEERVLRDAHTFHIGEDLRNDFIIPEEKLPKKFPLFRADRKGNYQIGLTRELNGEITVNQNTESIDNYVKKATENVSGVNYVPIGMGDWGMVRMNDDLGVFFQFVQPDAGKTARSGLLAFEEGLSGSLSTAAFLILGFVVIGIMLWEDQASRDVAQEGKFQPSIEAVAVAIDEPELEPEPEEEEEDDEVSKKAGGEEGEFGDPDKIDEESVIPELEARMVDEIDVKNIGLNELLSTDKLGGSALADIMKETTEGMSNKLAVAMGGEGSELLIGAGAGGMGFTGDGNGGGGSGVGRIQGMGSIDTGAGNGVRVGLGSRGKRKVGKLNLGSGRSTGFCKKSAIASVVRRRAGAIKACYEQRLQVKKGLKGKLTVQWTIGTDGKVSAASPKNNTLGDSNTTNCIMRHVRRMRFTKPEGGVCIVQWPFVFAPG